MPATSVEHVHGPDMRNQHVMKFFRQMGFVALRDKYYGFTGGCDGFQRILVDRIISKADKFVGCELLRHILHQK